MATASADRPSEEGSLPATGSQEQARDTAHLKLVPPTRATREQIRRRAAEVAAGLDKSRPLARHEMEAISRQLLERLGLADGFLGWTMVALVTAFWRDQVAAIPPERRLFLFPRRLEHSDDCSSDDCSNGDCSSDDCSAGDTPAGATEFGPFVSERRACAACQIAALRALAEGLGYRVLAAASSSVVLEIIVSGHVDAIVGVATLDVLEKAIDKVLLAGIPCMAVPLLSDDEQSLSVDDGWVDEMLTTAPHPPEMQTRTYLHLMRAASGLFDTDELERLAPRLRGGPRLADLNGEGVGGLDPAAATEAIAYDFLVKGGKHSRPFITLAVYDALTGGRGTLTDGAAHLESLSVSVKRAALSIETFHKASLVHDDIEDDDLFRYGEQTLHRKFGLATAINVGDYLIGLGYRLITREGAAIGAAAAADILERLADAHMRLCEGQGAELVWRDARHKRLETADALKIYALKTAPAFEAALYAGLRLAAPHAQAPVERWVEPLGEFARNLGVAFQILNDLGDWQQDGRNKLLSGGDVLGGRPTVLWALALEALGEEDRRRLEALVARQADASLIEQVRDVYQSAGVFASAARLIDKYRARAEAVAASVQPEELRRLLRYLIDTVLDRAPALDIAAESAQPENRGVAV